MSLYLTSKSKLDGIYQYFEYKVLGGFIEKNTSSATAAIIKFFCVHSHVHQQRLDVKGMEIYNKLSLEEYSRMVSDVTQNMARLNIFLIDSISTNSRILKPLKATSK